MDHAIDWAQVGPWVAAMVAIAFVSFRSSPSLQGPAAHLLKSLFPSWRFFDDAGPIPVLFVRTGPDRDRLGPWIAATTRPRPRLCHLLVNAEVLEHLAHETAVARLIDDIAELDDDRHDTLAQMVSYRMVARLAQLWARARQPHASMHQFKVASMLADELIDDLVLSPPLPLATAPLEISTDVRR